MSSNSFSTDPPDDFPEVDDYSEVDELDEPEPGSESAEEAGPSSANPGPASTERPAARVGLDLHGDQPIVGGPVDLTDDGPLDTGGIGGGLFDVDRPARPVDTDPDADRPAVDRPPPSPSASASASGEPGDAGHPIDQVAVRKLGGFDFLSIGQWSGLPRDERARLLEGGLVMFLFEGDEVPAPPALAWLSRLG